MKRNFVKINEINYFMVREPTETDKEMIDNGYKKVTDAQFDKAFNLYEKVQKKEITYKDVLRELVCIIPDRIIVGELNSREALALLDAWRRYAI
jgi:type IV secretory pathway ATPase VirB11/archaellum biosynthesis ATPase